MSKQLGRRFRTECCDSPFRDGLTPSREKSTLSDKVKPLQLPPIVAPVNIVSTWIDRYRFDARSLN
jgi:hypothetical protein